MAEAVNMIDLLAAIAAVAIEPMLDGRCDEYRPGAQAIELDHGVRLHLAQTRDHVWLCFSVPEGSYGTLDLRVESPQLANAMNLHASAQLGEWAADDPAAAPKNAQDPLWGRVHGWWANVVGFEGISETPEGPQVSYRTLTAREIQLSKARFDRGEWLLLATLSDIAVPEGQASTVRWPAKGAAKITAS
jgi:hypothetical protein